MDKNHLILREIYFFILFPEVTVLKDAFNNGERLFFFSQLSKRKQQVFSHLSERLESYKYTKKIRALEFCSSISRIDTQKSCIEKWLFFKQIIILQSDKLYILLKFSLLKFKYCKINLKASSYRKLLVLYSNRKELCTGAVVGIFTERRDEVNEEE